MSDYGVENERFPTIWANVLGMKFRRIDPGTFKMGSPETEPRRFADETRREVTLTRRYYLSVFPTTQAQWRAVVGENPSKNNRLKNAPVERVSFYDCVKFIEKMNSDEYLFELSAFLGEDWRYGLPTEAQWERACRAGTETAFYFGDVATGKEGNFGKVGAFGKAETTCEVGSFPPNAWGFYDFCGNVCEWTADRYGEWDAAPTTDPIGPASGAERVLRGGSWRSAPDSCRSAARFNYLPTYRGDAVGLRVGIFQRRR